MFNIGLYIITTISLCKITNIIDTIWENKSLQKWTGTTNNKEKLIKDFEEFCMRFNKADIWVCFDHKDKTHCVSNIIDLDKNLEIRKIQINKLKEILISQNWESYLDKESKNEIDFNKLKNINGKYSGYKNLKIPMFYLSYIEE